VLVSSLGRLVRKDVHRWQEARSDVVKQNRLGRMGGFDGEASSVFRKCH